MTYGIDAHDSRAQCASFHFARYTNARERLQQTIEAYKVISCHGNVTSDLEQHRTLSRRGSYRNIDPLPPETTERPVAAVATNNNIAAVKQNTDLTIL